MRILNVVKSMLGGSTPQPQTTAPTIPPQPISFEGGVGRARGGAPDPRDLKELDRLTFGTPPPEPKAQPVKLVTKLDAWETKFKCAPYFQPGTMLYNRLHTLEEMTRRAGVPMLTDSERARLADGEAQFQTLHAELGSITDKIIHDKISGIVAANEEKIKMGQDPDILPNRSQLTEQNQLSRQHIRGRMKALGIRIQPTIREISERMAQAARKVAEQLDAEERREADAWRMSFEPSQQLCWLVWFAVDGFRLEFEAFTPGAMGDPGSIFQGALHHSHGKKRLCGMICG